MTGCEGDELPYGIVGAALEPCERADVELKVVLTVDDGSGEAREKQLWSIRKPTQHSGDFQESARLTEPRTKRFAHLLNFQWAIENDQRILGHVGEEVGRLARARTAHLRDAADRNNLERFDRPLCAHVKTPDGFDFIPVELETIGCRLAGSEEIDNLTAPRHVAGRLDEIEAFKPSGNRPLENVVRRDASS